MRRTRLTAVTAGLLLAVAACGGNDNNSGGGGGGGGSDASALPKLDGQKIEVAAVWTGAEQQNFQKVLDEFQKRTGATVTYTGTGDDVATVIGTRIAGGNPPDVAMLPQPGLMQEFGKKGQLKELPQDVADLVKKNYSQDWVNLGSVNGKLYGVWFKAANKSTVWYRPKAFEDAGVQEPKTWDEFVKAAQTLADSGVTPVSVGGADGWTLTDWFENVYLRSAGGEKYDQLTKHEIPWTDQSVKDALSKLAELWGKPSLLVGGTNGALATDFPTSVSNVFGQNAKGAIVYEGDFVAGNITELGGKPGETAKFFDFPSVNGSQPAVVGGGDVAVMLKDSEGAKALMKWLSMPESAEIWAKAGGLTSPNKAVDTSVYPDAIAKKSAEALVGAQTFRFDMSDLAPSAFGGTPGQGEWKALQDFLKNPSNVDGAAQQLEKAAAAAYK